MSVGSVDNRIQLQPPPDVKDFTPLTPEFARTANGLADYEAAGPSDLAPPLDQLAAIGKPAADGTISYETKDGRHLVLAGQEQ